jgi:hypothetical protein
MSEKDEREMVRREGEEEKDEVEAHAKKAMTDEPSADEESGDDFEAHMKKA